MAGNRVAQALLPDFRQLRHVSLDNQRTSLVGVVGTWQPILNEREVVGYFNGLEEVIFGGDRAMGTVRPDLPEAFDLQHDLLGVGPPLGLGVDHGVDEVGEVLGEDLVDAGELAPR